MSIKHISRRDFFKDITLASLGFITLRPQRSFLNMAPSTGYLGRVLQDKTSSHKQPTSKSPVETFYSFNDLLQLSDPVTRQSIQGQQETWYRLADGAYISSYSIQLVKNQLNTPLEEIHQNGQLAQVTVPFTTAWASGATKKKSDQLFFYDSTHWVYALGEDQSGKRYYLVREDRWADTYYVEAAHMHIVNEEELEPIHADIPLEEKWIRINLLEQYAVAYESGEPIFLTKLSSGQLSGDTDRTTPVGEFVINYKRPSRHMVHSDRTGGINNSELYGVPWVSYFTNTGIAFHGTYWHNDFTRPRSHGCINLPVQAARWIYLWSLPVVPPREKKFVSNKGTRVEVL